MKNKQLMIAQCSPRAGSFNQFFCCTAAGVGPQMSSAIPWGLDDCGLPKCGF